MTNEQAIAMLSNLAYSIDELYRLNADGREVFGKAIEALKARDQALNEWCTDCKEYDHKKHCCPRFKRVIKSALEDATDTNVGDTVYRQAVMDALNRFSLGETDAMKLYSRMDNYLKKLQPAEPQTEINMAYMRGKIDGINYCTERLREIRMGVEHED